MERFKHILGAVMATVVAAVIVAVLFTLACVACIALWKSVL